MKKYSWRFDNKRFCVDWQADTIEECIAEARKVNAKLPAYDKKRYVYIGENMPIKSRLDVTEMLDAFKCDVSAELGISYNLQGWRTYDFRKKEELEELQAKVIPIVIAWQKKHGYHRDFCTIENIKRYDL